MKKVLLTCVGIIISLLLIGCNDSQTISSSEEPTTEMPTTQSPTTEVPTTQSPTTETPTTQDGTTEAPTTQAPTTSEPTVLGDRYFQYSVNSSQNILLTNIDITDDYYLTDLDGNSLDAGDIIVKNDYYEIKSDYILSKDEEVVEFYLYFDNYKSLISITLNEKDQPYIISSSVVHTDGESDLVFQFELFDGIIKQVNGNELSESDYLINDNLLTIESLYINDQFNDSDSFSIDYVLEEDGLVLGFININLD
ncbi:MAG: hypothetical protein ACOC2U_02260 [bacterium]